MNQINEPPDVFLTAWPSVVFFAVIAFPILFFMRRKLIVGFAAAFAFNVWLYWVVTGLLPHFQPPGFLDILLIGLSVCLSLLAIVMLNAVCRRWRRSRP
jgi:hypothetical protein